MIQQLPDGRYFQFDEVDASLVAAHKWHMVNGYVQTEVGSRKDGTRHHLRLHRLIMGAGPDQNVDHHNRNVFDNRRANLRVATKSQNGMNRSVQENNTSGFKGVSLHRKTGKWRATIAVDRQRRHLGLFVTPEEAYAAYLLAAEQLHGEFACG